MPPSQNREEAIFQAGVQLTGAERAVFLNGACLGDEALRQRLEALLAAHDEPDDLAPATAAVRPTIKLDLADEPADEAVGQTLGRYKLLERVGEGGCGVVYVAEQTEPVRRRVALKVIKLGMDTKQVVARFEAERQALAMMDHPNIAKVLDAGTTDVGRPYFVMELVRGIKITDYCDQANCTTKERLDLFIKICQAIQHAHQKGIIHRDIKPSNILVTLHDGVPVPKVIDFGIAKATEGRLTDNTVYTQLHQFIGTPAYMSPEQAEMSGLDIDTRSDIYSLGVLLYELLAGSTPFDAKDLMASGIDAMRKTIREKEPQRPSTRLATLGADQLTTTAKRRSADTSKLLHQLKGDLDWIVMKCLEKDRQRRYETANGLAADINRHLNNEPVIARPPSAAYKFQKAIRRNKLAFTAATAVALALAVGLGMAALGWRQTGIERDKALQAKTQALAAKGEAEQSQRSEQQQRLHADQERERAKAGETKATRLLYGADMNLAQQFVIQNNLGRALQLLDRHRPAPGQEDLRGWEWRYLWQQCRSDALAVLTQRHQQPATSVSFSPDGAQLAVGYDDGRLELWDVARRALLKELQTNGINTKVAFSPRSNVLAVTANRGTLKLHDLASGRETVLWSGWSARTMIRELSFTPDGQRLVAFVFEIGRAAAVTFDLAQGLTVGTNGTAGGNNFQGGARLSSDRKRLFLSHRVGGSGQQSVRCLDFETGQQLWQTELGTDERMSALALSPDDKFLVAALTSQDVPIQVVNAVTGQLVSRLVGHRGMVRELTFSRDGRRLASASEDQTIRLWNSSGAGWTQGPILRGHQDAVLTVAFSADGKLLASGAKDGSILLWDAEANRTSNYGHREISNAMGSIREVAPGLALLNGTRSLLPPRQVEAPVLLRLEDLSESPVPPGFDFEAPYSVFHTNIFVSYEQTNVLRVVEFRNGWTELFREVVGPDLQTWGGSAVPAAPGSAPAPEQLRVAWVEASGAVHVAELGPLKRRWQWTSELRPPTQMVFSPDGSLLLLLGPPSSRSGFDFLRRQGLEVWEVATGRLRLKSDLPIISSSVGFADAGRRLAAETRAPNEGPETSAPNEGRVLFWDLTRPEQPPKVFPQSFRSRQTGALNISPDGRWVSVIGKAGAVVLYDAVAMERRLVVQGAMQEVNSTAFSPDRPRFVSGAGGRDSIQIWQVDTGQELLTLPSKPIFLFTVMFAEDGNTLIAGSKSRGSWQIWRAPSWEEIAAVETKEGADSKKP